MQYFTSIKDSQVPAKYSADLKHFRDYATKIGVDEKIPVCYKVKAGFTLKRHAPKSGNCYENFKYLQDWDFEDKPTEESCVFWIPKILPNSFSKTADEQRQLLKNNGFDELFGEASLLAGLILHHFEKTKERIPEMYVRTDSRLRDSGRRLFLGSFDRGGLGCDYWGWAGAYSYLGCFTLGVKSCTTESKDTEVKTLETRLAELEEWKNKVDKILKV